MSAPPPSAGDAAAARGAALRIFGILLFLPVPIVLVLFTRMPFGAVPSIAIGLVLMMTHPLYARPWALRQAPKRCLWCGGPVSAGVASGGGPGGVGLTVADPRGTVSWCACGDEHRASLATILGIVSRYAIPLRIGIFGTVAVSLGAAILASRGWLDTISSKDASAFFRLGVAVTVLPLGWLGARLRAGTLAPPPVTAPRPAARIGGPADSFTAPFPIHLGALIGVNAVLWLFRLVGLIWLAQGAFYFSDRLT
jgi:hypothetical protein